MAKSVTALKNVLKREEALLLTLKKTVSLMSHRDSKILIREMMKNKMRDIKHYKQIIKQSANCPAIQKKTR